MNPTERCQALGRIAGADMARALVDAMSQPGADKSAIAAICEAGIRAQLARLAADGASPEQCSAFAEAADRRYSEALAEIMITAEIGMLAAEGPGGVAH